MKKRIALFLCASMMLSLAACTDTRNTRTTRDTKETTEDTTPEPTEESTTESTSETTTEETTEATTTTEETTTKEETTTTEETTTSSEETTTESTEETSSEETTETTTQPTSGPKDPSELYGTDLTYSSLTLKTNQDYFVYKFKSAEKPGLIGWSMPYFDFASAKNDDLKKSVDETLTPHQEAIIARNNIAKKEYDQKKSSGDSLSVAGFNSYNIQLFRNDSQILSYAVNGSPLFEGPEDSRAKDTIYEGHTFDVATGKELKLKDVVKDVDEFTSLVYAYLDSSNLSEEDKKAILNSIDTNSFNFALTYDSIHCLFVRRGRLTMNYFNISAMAHPDVFNMEYFGHTPEYYFLKPDAKGNLYWDFDGDGKTDEMKLEPSTDDYDWGFAIKISINGETYNSERDLPDSYGEYSHAYYVKSDDGQYLYVVVDEEDVYNNTYIFRIEGTKVTFVGEMDEYDAEPDDQPFFVNPEEFTLSSMDVLLGTSTTSGTYTLLGCDGNPKMTRSYYTSEHRHTSKMPLDAYSYDYNTGEAGKTVQIQQDSLYLIEAFNPDEGTIVFKIYEKGKSEFYYVQCTYERKGGAEFLMGTDIKDIFNDIVYAG